MFFLFNLSFIIFKHYSVSYITISRSDTKSVDKVTLIGRLALKLKSSATSIYQLESRVKVLATSTKSKMKRRSDLYN